MDVVRVLLPALAHLLSFAALGLSGLLYCHLRSRLSLLLWLPKILAGSLAALLVAAGASGAALGLGLHAPPALLAGGLGAALAALHVWRVTAPLRALEPPPRRKAPAGAPARRQRDLPFWTVPGTGRPLLCDLWQPPAGQAPTGVGLVYLHSSAWHLADKDLWTRPLFRHLAAQGHVVMDVAYRLCPEVGILGMLADARRAIAWLRANAARHGVDPARIVAMGASAGGQLALLAAYIAGHPDLTPPDLEGADTSVRAVVSCYGLADMRACYRHMERLLPAAETVRRLEATPLLAATQGIAAALPGLPVAGQLWKLPGMSRTGIVASLLGGGPDEVPAMYDLASPLAHAGPHCPPTLLIHGEHDAAIPLPATLALRDRLIAAGVPVESLLLPQTDHLFDLVLPQISPAAWVARRHLDRFLARFA